MVKFSKADHNPIKNCMNRLINENVRFLQIFMAEEDEEDYGSEYEYLSFTRGLFDNSTVNPGDKNPAGIQTPRAERHLIRMFLQKHLDLHTSLTDIKRKSKIRDTELADRLKYYRTHIQFAQNCERTKEAKQRKTKAYNPMQEPEKFRSESLEVILSKQEREEIERIKAIRDAEDQFSQDMEKFIKAVDDKYLLIDELAELRTKLRKKRYADDITGRRDMDYLMEYDYEHELDADAAMWRERDRDRDFDIYDVYDELEEKMSQKRKAVRKMTEEGAPAEIQIAPRKSNLSE